MAPPSGKMLFIISYRQGGIWMEKGKADSMSKALKVANKLYESKKYPAVKVDQHFTDSNNRTVVTTIYDKKIERQRNPVAVLLVVSILMGVIMYFITGTVLQHFLK